MSILYIIVIKSQVYEKINIKPYSEEFVKLSIERTTAAFVAMPETRPIAQPN